MILHNILNLLQILWCCWGGLNSRPKPIKYNKNSILLVPTYICLVTHLVTLGYEKLEQRPSITKLIPNGWLPDSDSNPKMNATYKKVLICFSISGMALLDK